ncbi:hypothetical protein DFH09DRAFT_1086950 [Mycena vulgaris]|nr:hypothetical protein DFH09DRAFT_1086950 [Mycena vulgaris]
MVISCGHEYAASSSRPIRRRNCASGGCRMVFSKSDFRTEVFTVEQQSNPDPAELRTRAGVGHRPADGAVLPYLALSAVQRVPTRINLKRPRWDWSDERLDADGVPMAWRVPRQIQDTRTLPDDQETLHDGTVNGLIPGMRPPPRICIPCAEGMPPVDDSRVCYLSIHTVR